MTISRRRMLRDGMTLGLVGSGVLVLIPPWDVNAELAAVDNAIDATRLLGFNRWERIFVLGLDPSNFRSFDDVRTYARVEQPLSLFNRAKLLVELQQKVINQFGVEAVARAMDWREQGSSADSTFRKLVNSAGFREGFRYTDYDALICVGSVCGAIDFDDDYYGNIRPARLN